MNETELREQMGELAEALASIERTKKIADATIRLGKAYRYRNSYSMPETDADYWWTYRKVLSVDDDGHCRCLEFHVDRDGRAQINLETARHFSGGWQEIPANVFARGLAEFRKHVGTLIDLA